MFCSSRRSEIEVTKIDFEKSKVIFAAKSDREDQESKPVENAAKVLQKNRVKLVQDTKKYLSDNNVRA